VPLTVELDRSSPVPLYYQLAQAIEAAIRDGELAPGDRFENELALAKRLTLSRPTTRRAIQELVDKGLLVRKRGVGTQVLSRQINRQARLSSLYDDLVASGRDPQTRLLSYEVGPAGPEVLSCGADIDPSTIFVTIKRLRLADGVPLAIMVNHLPEWLAISEADLADGALYALLRSRGINLRVAPQTVSARLMTAEECRLLSDRQPSACMAAQRVVYDDTGRLIEIGRHVYRASHYSLDVSLVP